MAAVTTEPGAAGPGLAGRDHRPATFADALRCELTKMRTVRSTFWTLLTTVVLSIGLGALFSALAAHHYARATLSGRAGWDPTSISTSGLGLAQLAIGVLGVLAVTSEYSTGSIRTSLAAVPRRGRFLAAKAAVLTAVSLMTGEVLAVATFLIGQALISGQAPTASFGQPGVLRAVLGSGLYLAALGLLGVALGTLLRHSAAAIAVLVAVVFVLPGIAAALPARIERNVEEYWPTMAGAQVTAVVRGAHQLGAWSGFGVMCLFVAVAMTAAMLALARRDA
jgi:ABC-type transport system involved in multi-copper enzyme maturation permease subunit